MKKDISKRNQYNPLTNHENDNIRKLSGDQIEEGDFCCQHIDGAGFIDLGRTHERTFSAQK